MSTTLDPSTEQIAYALRKIRFWQENLASNAASYETREDLFQHYGGPTHRRTEAMADLLADVLQLFESRKP